MGIGYRQGFVMGAWRVIDGKRGIGRWVALEKGRGWGERGQVTRARSVRVDVCMYAVACRVMDSRV